MSTVPNETLAQAKKDALAIVSPIRDKVNSLVVKDQTSYMAADTMLFQVRQAKQLWLGKINPIIEPIYRGLELLYSLRKEGVDPLDEYESSIKGKMKQFKLEEKRQIEEANRLKEAELARLREEALRKQAAEANAKTEAMRKKLAAQREALEQQAVEAEATHTLAAAPIKVAGSSTRNIRRWKVEDQLALLKHIISQGENDMEDLMSLVKIDDTQMNAYFKLAKPPVGYWLPGVKVYDDIDIAGRR